MKRLLLALVLLLLPVTTAAQNMSPSPQTLNAAFSSSCTSMTCATWQLNNNVSATLQVTGTFSGTLTFYTSSDGGQTYLATSVTKLSDGTYGSTSTSGGQFALVNVGLTHVQVRFSAWTSGGANISATRGYGSGGGGGGGGGAGDASASNQTNGNQKTQIVDGSGNVIGATSNALDVNIKSGGGSGGTSAADGATFTASSTSATPVSGFYEASPSTCATGKACAVGLTTNRELKASVSGVATAANQSTEITSLQLIDNLPNTLGSTTSGQSGALALGAVTTASPSYTTAQTNALSLDTSGSLRVAIVSGAGSGGTALADGATFTPNSTSLTPVGGLYESSPTTCTSGDACVAGMTTNRTLKATLFTAAGVEVPVATTTEVTQDTALGTVTSVKGLISFCRASAAAPTGVSADDYAVLAWCLRSGALATQLTAAGALIGGDATNGLDVDVTRMSALVAGTANIGDVDVLTLPADPLGANADAAATAGSTGSISAKLRLATQQFEDIKTAVQLIDNDQTGSTATGVVSAASTNSTSVTATASRLIGMYLTNNTTTIYYIRFYNASSAPTCSSATNFVFTMAVPPAAASGGAGGFSMPFGPQGLAFSTGIGYCLTGGPTSTDNTNAAVGIYGVLATK